MNEFQWIDKLKNIKNFYQIDKNIGDDGAVIGKNIICSDTLVENVHFSFNYYTIKEVIKKAILVNISDILAMNGVPKYYLLNLTIPKKDKNCLDQIIEAIDEINNFYKIDIIGGDTTSIDKNWVISVTMIGETDNPIYRDGAKLGDGIYIGGDVGKSGYALKCLLRREKSEYKKFHVSPKIDLNFLKLFKKIDITSMIDVSDGVLNDLKHILEQSKKGAILDIEKILSIDKKFVNILKNRDENELDIILNGGEDFIPLFTTSKDEKSVYSLAKNIKVPVFKIGEIIDKEGIFNKNGDFLIPKGYLHF